MLAHSYGLLDLMKDMLISEIRIWTLTFTSAELTKRCYALINGKIFQLAESNIFETTEGQSEKLLALNADLKSIGQ